MRKPSPETVAIPLGIAIEAISVTVFVGCLAALLIVMATPVPNPVPV